MGETATFHRSEAPKAATAADYQRDGANLLNMLIWARRASDYVRERTDAEFAADALLQDATIRCVEGVGEAASRVSAEWESL